MRIACGELTAEETAEVEARVQSSLLVARAEGIGVRMVCEPGLATVTAHDGERSESRSVPLPEPKLPDALVRASEAALEAVLAGRPSATASFPSEASPDTAVRALPPERTETARSSASDTRTAPPDFARPRADTRALRVGAGALGESWSGTLVAGGRVVAEYSFGAPLLGLAAGVLAPLERDDDFAATEWHAQAHGGFRAAALGDVRGTVAFGFSMLTVAPDDDVLALSDTSVARAFGEFAVSRPVSVRRWTIVPSLGVRWFPWALSVTVDGVEQARLSGLNAGLFLGLLYEP